MNGVLRNQLPPGQGRLRLSKPVDSRIAALNEALSQIEEDDNGGRGGTHGPVSRSSYAAESIERPRRRIGPNIAKRMSYVERSYNKLTNDVYSENSLIGPSEANTTDLSKWAS